MENAMAVLDIINCLIHRGFGISEDAIRTGLAQATWPGRFELLSREPLLIVDGAHNPNGVEALVDTIRAYFPDQKINFVMGVMKDKDYHTMLRLIAPYASRFITELPDAHRALRPEQLKSEIRAYFDGPVETADSVTAAVQRAIEIAERSMDHDSIDAAQARRAMNLAGDSIDEGYICRQPITICFGSLYQVAEIRNYFISSSRSTSNV